jgi:hypothetical protein
MLVWGRVANDIQPRADSYWLQVHAYIHIVYWNVENPGGAQGAKS